MSKDFKNENTAGAAELPSEGIGSQGKSEGTGRKARACYLVAAVVTLLAVCFVVSKAAGLNFIPNAASTGNTATVQSTESINVQNIVSELAAGCYPVLTVRKGVPVRWNLQADASVLNGCNCTVLVPAFGIEKRLQPGDNFIEFMPAEAGTIPFSCKMGMIHSSIIVVEGP